MLSGEVHPITNVMLWPDFSPEWPLLTNPDNGRFVGATDLGSPGESAGQYHSPAHQQPDPDLRPPGDDGGAQWFSHSLFVVTILLGATFLGLQAHEYIDDYERNNLTLNAGIYGSLFYILTGFHGFHVLVGVIMISTMLWRAARVILPGREITLPWRCGLVLALCRCRLADAVRVRLLALISSFLDVASQLSHCDRLIKVQSGPIGAQPVLCPRVISVGESGNS